ncbi:MAG TPA: class I SAM-dependent methyltransferase [Gaiellaceae bacterium]
MDDFAQRACRLILRREPDEDAAGRLERGEVSRARLVRELVESREFERVELLDDGLARARSERLKQGRPRELLAPAWADERAVEIPWALARYRGERRVLDVGYAFAEPAYLEGLTALGAGELVGVDLAEAEVRGLRSVVADVRELPFERRSFDLAFCISTLEHIGRDNAVYSVDTTREEEGDAAALRELRRVLGQDGRLLVSVPTGERDDQGWQLQRTPEDWIAVFEGAGFVVYEDELYVHAPDGWRTATLDEARSARYGEHTAGAVLLAELHPSSAGEKLRLAVRDVRHRGEIRRSTSA